MTARVSTPQEFMELKVATPTPTGESQPFWDALARGVLLVQKCAQCGRTQGYARRRCASCWADALSWIEVKGNATVVTHTLVHHPGQASWADVAPYYVGLVKLDEGAVMMTHLLAANETPRVGDRCSVTPVKVGEWVLPFFSVDPSTL